MAAAAKAARSGCGGRVGVGVGVDVFSVCRLCAQIPSSPPTYVFSEQEPRPLLYLIKQYLQININIQDQVSLVVCSECHGKMVSFHEFAIKCNNIQKYLLSLQEQSLIVNDNAVNELKAEWDSQHVEFNVKIKTEENMSVKSEDFTDHFNADDDLIPISECIKKKSKKKKAKSSDEKHKRHKKDHIDKEKNYDSMSTDDQSGQIKEEVGHYDGEVNRENLDGALKLTRRYKYIMTNNSFINFVCHICPADFPNWCALKSHCKQTHNSKAKVKCLCDKFLYTRHAISRHIVKHDNTCGYKCETCKKTYTTPKALKIHSYTHLPKDQYSHVCSHCAKRFPTSMSLKIHEKTHIPKELRYIHPCDICGIKFISKGNVRAHVSAVHEKHRPYVCDICGHAFNNKGNLLDHRVLHSDEKLFSCSICSRSFKTKGTLQRHMDCHNGTSYKCPECPAILNSRRTLRTHMCIHEDTYRYKCAFCSKGYKRRKSLKSHMNIHTGERPYSCLWCTRTFADNSNCRIHKRRMHPTELAEYEAIHGKYQDIKNDNTEVKKVIYNTTFKKKSESAIIVMPDIVELIQESQTQTMV
ncbi:uncharacterized protein LOC143919556 [Arctopsyche grandis]|uniref:uncharacterized protein LOC143919556 n=1 Tax=Arctopsyche grandis TaxID=121162 RepID=UPI00406D8994